MVSRANKKRQPFLDTAANILQEAIMNVKTVQSCNGQNQMVQNYSNALASGRIYGIFTYFWNGFFDGLFFLFLYTFYGVGLCWGVVEYYNGKTTAADVLIVTNCIMVGSYLLGFISPHIMAVLKARVAAATIYSRIERLPNIECHLPKGVELLEPKGHIQFCDVDFEYPSRRTCRVLKKICVEVEAGQSIALVGKSGSGKSSCVSFWLF
jgi:ATP-binding cassette subfamily B (MDR/TAP) protein 1